MQNINNYKSDSIYTFNTAIIGKEDIIVTTNTNKIIIPGFQLGFQFEAEIKYFEKAYLIFNNVFLFNNVISFYANGAIETANEYKIEFTSFKNVRQIEIESTSFRDNLESFSTIKIYYESVDIFYNKEIDYKIVFNWAEAIKSNKLNSFLILDDLQNDIENTFPKLEP
jgi:hypothetical protein